MLTTPPLSLYIHFPWCIRKCPYCDFNSHTLKTDLPEDEYIDTLIVDLDNDLKKIQTPTPLISIFMGGGTPSLFSATALKKLLDAIQQRIEFSPNIEITLEANPGTVEYQRFAGYHEAGINRLSIGIQSFQTEKLKALGRIHDAQEAIRAAETAHRAGFTNFNLDLMHGLPQQSLAEGLQDLQTAIALNPTHLSWYQLTLEPNTLFAKQPPQLPHEEIIWELQEQGKHLLKQHGFEQYEISAYAKNNHQSQHNLNYWQFGDYLGIGAGAHSKITDTQTQQIIRTWKVKNPRDYLTQKNNFIGEEKIIPAKELPFEFMLNALRLYQTIPLTLFSVRTGLSLEIIKKPLIAAEKKELLTWNETSIQTTDLGRQFYNNLVEIFI